MGDNQKVLRRCKYCGQFFRVHPFVGSRQKACSRNECQKKRKQMNQKNWQKKNPDYFLGRYPEIKQWRVGHPDYQKQWRTKRREIQDLGVTKTSTKSLRLVIPENLLNPEIQDLALHVSRCGCGFWVAGVPERDTRRDGRDCVTRGNTRPL